MKKSLPTLYVKVSSYKQLPITLYQIQTKFRDEIRPRFGVMRAREFLMKDAYSFHKDEDSLEETYNNMYDAYQRIFQRLGLRFRAVLADSGNIGGKRSHEFHVLAESGEDTIAYCNNSDYAANVELATSITPAASNTTDGPALNKVHTPSISSIEALSEALAIPADQTIKVILVRGEDAPLVACVIRGDHTINPIKLAKHPLVQSPVALASEQEIDQHLGLQPGFIGPIELAVPMIVDPFAAALDNFTCGANETDYHFQHAHWGRDCTLGEVVDIREVCPGDISPDNQGELEFTKGIEVGHIFNLGTKYSKSMQAHILDENGSPFPIVMGCYGIGVSRIIAAAIEQNHDENGIIWPEGMAPFKVHIIPMNYKRSETVQTFCATLEDTLAKHNIDFVLDDRDLRAGALFADADLIGVPHQVIVGERGIASNQVEYKNRLSGEKSMISIEALIDLLTRSN